MRWTVLGLTLGVCAFGHVASVDAAVIYDAITGRNLTAPFVADPGNEIGQEVILSSTGSINNVELAVFNRSTSISFSGAVTLSIYEASTSTGLPGALLSRQTIQAAVAANTRATLSIAFPDVSAPSTTLWLSTNIANASNGQGILGFLSSGNDGPIAVGQTRAWVSQRIFNSGPWNATIPQTLFNGAVTGFRISTVPTPMAAGLLVPAGLLSLRRRR